MRLGADGLRAAKPDVAGCTVLIGTRAAAGVDRQATSSASQDEIHAQPLSGLAVLARAHQVLERGVGAVVLQQPADPGRPTREWLATFLRHLRDGASPTRAARAADASTPGSAAGPASVVFGNAFEPVKLEEQVLLVPWVGAVALAAVLALLAALVFGLRRKEP
jgi:hypothetical protein